jgi:hypothetical protein
MTKVVLENFMGDLEAERLAKEQKPLPPGLVELPPDVVQTGTVTTKKRTRQ